jgi:DNA-binding Lrp family transcriptional regulator
MVSALSRAGDRATRAPTPRIVSADLAAFQRLYDDELSALPGVQRLTSTLVMKHVVSDRPLPA